MKLSRMLSLLFLLVLATAAPAQVPETMSYQGVLTDGAGVPAADGTYSITFKLYDVDAGGTDLWTETHSVDVTGGIFNAVLGSQGSPLTIPFTGQYWLGISVDGGAEMSPRRMLTSAPYSLNARSIDGALNLFTSEGDVGIGTKTPGVPLHVVSDVMNGIRYDGLLSASWASIVVNAQGGASQPSYEYYRGGGYTGRTFMDNNNNWHLQLGGDQIINVITGSALVGLGVEDPAERLDVDGGVRIGSSEGQNAGTIRWTGADFEGYNGSAWQSLTGGGGSLPSGTEGQTLRHNGSVWEANSALYNDGSNIGIGTTNPQQLLHVNGLARFDLPTGQINVSTPGGWPGFIAYATNGNRRDIVFDNSRMYLSASSSSSAPASDNGIVLFENGQIGIGTNTPADKVHVRDTGATYVNIDAPAGYASGVNLSVDGTPEWALLYNPNEGTMQFFKQGTGAKMVIGDGGRVGIGTTTLSGLEWLEVHNPNPSPGEAAITGYSYFNQSPSFGGGIAVAGIHSDDGVGGTGVYGEATDGDGMYDSQVGVYGYSDDGYGVFSSGTLASTGEVVSFAATKDYGHRHVYAMQSAGNWCEDFGEGRLSGGEAVVEIDPVFAQTVAMSRTYHVFLTPLGDGSLYVAEKGERSFTVRARSDGGEDIAFDYRIVAKRRGYETKRLERVLDPKEMERRRGIPFKQTRRPKS